MRDKTLKELKDLKTTQGAPSPEDGRDTAETASDSASAETATPQSADAASSDVSQSETLENAAATQPDSSGDGAPPETTTEPGTEIKKRVTNLPVDHFGTSVYVKGWRHRNMAKPYPILFVHDLGEHIGLYRNTAKHLITEGFAVYGFDLRGHGRSGRRLGHAPSFNVLVQDLLQVVAWVRHQEGGQPPILVGQGIGALVTMDFTKTYGRFCRAAVLSAPCFELSTTISTPARLAIKTLAELTPTMRIPKSLAPRFTKRLKHVHKIAEDADSKTKSAASFPRLTTIFAYELLQAIRRAKMTFTEFEGEILVLCPTEDSICDFTPVRQSAAQHKGDNLRIQDLDGVGHNVFTESRSGRMRAIEALTPWLHEVLQREPGLGGSTSAG